MYSGLVPGGDYVWGLLLPMPQLEATGGAKSQNIPDHCSPELRLELARFRRREGNATGPEESRFHRGDECGIVGVQGAWWELLVFDGGTTATLYRQ
jgi:hypothetical protein